MAEEAAFRTIFLIIYIVAIIAEAFLARASTDPTLSDGKEFVLWLRSVAAVLLLFAFYNLVWIARRMWWDASSCPTWRSLFVYIAHYAGFSTAFLVVASLIEANPSHNSQLLGFSCAFLFLLYLVTYHAIWWKPWHRGAISTASATVY